MSPIHFHTSGCYGGARRKRRPTTIEYSGPPHIEYRLSVRREAGAHHLGEQGHLPMAPHTIGHMGAARPATAEHARPHVVRSESGSRSWTAWAQPWAAGHALREAHSAGVLPTRSRMAAAEPAVFSSGAVVREAHPAFVLERHAPTPAPRYAPTPAPRYAESPS
jgi:hypothetical protein